MRRAVKTSANPTSANATFIRNRPASLCLSWVRTPIAIVKINKKAMGANIWSHGTPNCGCIAPLIAYRIGGADVTIAANKHSFTRSTPATLSSQANPLTRRRLTIIAIEKMPAKVIQYHTVGTRNLSVFRYQMFWRLPTDVTNAKQAPEPTPHVTKVARTLVTFDLFSASESELSFGFILFS